MYMHHKLLISQICQVIKFIYQPAKRIVVIPIPAASMLVGMDESSEKLVGMHPLQSCCAEMAC